MLRDARLMASKDLRIEMASRVVASQIIPFGFLVLILFGFGLSPDLAVVGRNRSVLAQVAPGLFWVAVLLSALLALGRSFAVESADGNLDGLRLAGLDPAGIFLGKAGAVAVELVGLEVVLGLSAFVLYGLSAADWPLLLITVLLATIGLSAVGTVYGALASGLRVRDTLVPLLLLPVAAPVLLGATRATEAALFGSAGDGWPWAGLLAVFALLYIGVGMLAFDPILEDS